MIWKEGFMVVRMILAALLCIFGLTTVLAMPAHELHGAVDVCF